MINEQKIEYSLIGELKQLKYTHRLDIRDNAALERNFRKKIVDTYRERPAKEEHYAHRVSTEEIEQNDFNLNISRYVSTATDTVEIKLGEVHQQPTSANKAVADATVLHNQFLQELGLLPI